MSDTGQDWAKLVDTRDGVIWRGALLRMPGGGFYEPVVDFMVIEIEARLGLLVASGYKAGIVRQVLPEEALEGPARALSRAWLIDNWARWVDQGSVQDVWISESIPAP
jgi:hypothetical protein